MHGASEALEQLLAIVAKAPRLRHDTTTRATGCGKQKILQRLAARVSRAEERAPPPADGSCGERRRRAGGRESAEARRTTERARRRATARVRGSGSCWSWSLAAPAILDRLAELVEPSQLVSRLVPGEIYETCRWLGRRRA